jgi:hypothetical protein
MTKEFEKVKKTLEEGEKAIQRINKIVANQTTELVLVKGSVETVQISRQKRVEYLTSLICKAELATLEERELR